MIMNLYDKTQKWYDGLNNKAKYNLMLKYYPEKAYLVGLQSVWMSLNGDRQMKIYEKESNE